MIRVANSRTQYWYVFARMGLPPQIRRGAHRTVRELEAAITVHIEARNADPKPFRWVKSADDILAAAQRFCQRTITIQDHCA